MIWLELRKNNQPYDEGWNFTQSVWAPTRKEDGAQWPFWYLINDVKKNDIVVHLKNANGVIEFTGYSYALADSYKTHNTPTNEEYTWDFIESFYKVDLYDYHEFESHISLYEFFHSNNQKLREYFSTNKKRKNNKKRLFYVIQSGRLQCLNGAYFSEFDEILIDLLTIQIKEIKGVERKEDVETGETLSILKTRIGHKQFAENVKRNFNYKCCFPDCDIKGRGFLVSGHITRWADNITLRGKTQNGLSLCLLHDRAFEKGYFTLDSNFNVRVVEQNLEANDWLKEFLDKGNNKPIKPRELDPSIKALEGHWKRIGYKR